MKSCKHCGIDLLTTKGLGNQCYTCKNGLERYNLTRLDMVKMHEQQNRCCALCDKPVELFTRRETNSGYIDHNHETGEVRSILCHPCNTSLGYIERCIDLNRLNKYLNKGSVAQLD